MDSRVKVTAFCAAGLLMLLAIVLRMSGTSLFSWDRYTLYIGFDEVSGIDRKSGVRFAGVEVGRVESVAVDGGRALATLSIRDDVRIPRRSVWEIEQDGVLGSYFVSVTPGLDTSDCLAPGERFFAGHARKSRELTQNVQKASEEMRALSDRLHEIADDAPLKRAAIGMAVDGFDLARSLERFLDTGQRVRESNADEIKETAENLRIVKERYSAISREAKELSDEFSGIDGARSDAAVISEKLSSAGRHMQSVSSALRPPRAGEPEERAE